MKREKNKRKIGIALLILMQLILFCSGCGKQEQIQSVPFPEEEKAPVLAPAPLLEWENPETENLAGLLQENCGGMMVQLTAGQYMGSGVICSAEEGLMVIVTAAHVLADVEDGVQITFVDNWVVNTTEYSISEQTDLAVVQVPLKDIPNERLEKYLTANLDGAVYDKLQTNDGCIVMGCKSGVAEDAYEGVVLEPWIYMEDYGQHMIWVKAPGKPGMSGGGLFDRKGYFLGILSGRSEDDEWAVVPLALVLEAL